MASIRVPYPAEPERRRTLFERLAAELNRFGTYEGTPEEGTFAGKSPVGRVAGRYHSPAGEGWLQIDLIEKPWLIPASVIELQLRLLIEDRLRSLPAGT